MSASKNSYDNCDENVIRASFYVQQVGRRYRRKGIKADDAIRRAAADLGISHDLAWKLNYRQRIFSLATYNLMQIQLAYLLTLDREIAEMERQTANLRSIKSELQKQLRGNACSDSTSTPLSSANDAGGGLSLAAI